MRIKLLLLTIIIFTGKLYGQAEVDFKTVESKTYAYYQAAQWDSLIHIGKQANKNGIDYYYLNYRVAVAYFYKKKYRLASFYFQKALDLNFAASNDAFFAELFHLSLVYDQRNDLAEDIPLPEKSEGRDPMTRNVFVLLGGGGKMINFNKGQLKINPKPEFSELRYQNAVNYWGIAFSHQFNSAFNLGLSYTKLHFLLQTLIEDKNSQLLESYMISQYNFALLPLFTLDRYWQLKPVFSIAITKGYPYGVVDTTHGIKDYSFYYYNENSFLVGLNVYRDFRYVKLGFNIGSSNYNKQKQFQLGLNLTYFPFGNLNLYTFSALSFKVDQGDEAVIIQQKVGVKVLSKLWLEGGGLFGHLTNYNDFNLTLGYNIADNIDMIVLAKFIFTANHHLNFFVEGQFNHRYTYRKDDYGVDNHSETKIKYDQLNIEGGLLWKF